MVYIVCALFIEAKPLINYYKLKRDMTDNFYQVFKGDEVSLIISGTGKVSSVCAVSHILSRGFSSEDLIVNAGLCGSSVYDKGSAFLVNKIVDNSTKREFFPDILVKHNFDEEYVETFDKPVSGDHKSGLCDMEASGFFQASLKYMPSHAVHVIKIVSDNLEGTHVDVEAAENMIELKVKDIDSYINDIKQIMKKDKFFEDFEEIIIESAVKNLNLTESQQVILKKQSIGFKLRHGNLPDVKNIIFGKVKTKNDCKKQFERLIGILSE